jgi:hypothetical protein
MTYKQAQELGGQVRKSEHGALVVYADRMRKTETAGLDAVKRMTAPCQRDRGGFERAGGRVGAIGFGYGTGRRTSAVGLSSRNPS